MKGKKGFFSDSADESDKTSTSTSFSQTESEHSNCLNFSAAGSVCASVSQGSELVRFSHLSFSKDKSVQTEQSLITEKKDRVITGWHFDIEAQTLVECYDGCEASGCHREVTIELAPLRKL